MQDLPLFLFVTVLAVLAPGSAVVWTVTCALRHGPRHIWASPVGTTIGATVIAWICAAGLGAVVAASPLLYALLTVVCAALLIWLGISTWRAEPVDIAAIAAETARSPEEAAKSRRAVDRSIFIPAVLIQATNPTIYVYMLSLLPQFIAPEADFTRTALILATIFGVIVLLGHLVWSAAAAWARRFLSGRKAALVLNRVCGAIFVLLAVSVLFDAFRTLMPALARVA
ncbi:LysE family translocator [Sutterella sp.]|uniref:LysE family translocator n=1 Tax=Sutterella sp. TaxID=1981025 RepID=UPI0026E0416F|nr:LysE family translocator [Sutterella sp.]MDO5532361.1 LysE family translocator [Sutterella sp.]